MRPDGDAEPRGPVDQGPGVVKAQQEGAVEQDGARRHRLMPPKQARPSAPPGIGEASTDED